MNQLALRDIAAPILAEAGTRLAEVGTGEQARAVFNAVLDSANEALFACFDQGDPVDDLVLARSRLVDLVIDAAWSLHVPAGADLALIAVGGYGRRELHPSSDVDIQILIGDSILDDLAEPLGNFITFLWDIGLQPGQSVRTVAECVEEARADVTVMTNLVEARLLAGSEPLYDAMVEATGAEHIWPSDAFFRAKTEEQKKRWRKYGDTAYNLEPNIKENPGGLRDIQMIGWVAKRHFGADTLHELVEFGFLTERELEALLQGQSLLWRIRFALHRLTGRHEDRLLFDYQRTLAYAFGFADGERTLAVEQFMQQYYRTVVELNQLNEMLLQMLCEAILLRGELGPAERINARFQIRGGLVQVVDDEVFKRYPAALLEVFQVAQTLPESKGIAAGTIRLIGENLHRLEDRVRSDLSARSLFMEILRHGRGLTAALRAMNRYGVLAAYIPAFANIVGRMQYDLFHVYTVDEHTLRLVRNLRRFSNPEHAGEQPLCSTLIQRIPKLELLYLAGLFHDIAKGRGGDHSKLGANDAWDFCQLHDLSEYDSRLTSWLVEHHLLMSMTAQRKDISDPQEVQTFAAKVGDTNRLNYLYLLTVADSLATNPARWNSWKDALLRDLYQAARRALERGLDNPQAQEELISEKQEEARRILAHYGFDPLQIRRLWASFSIDLFLQSTPSEVSAYTRLIIETEPEDLPLVAIRPKTARGSTEIIIYTQDQANLFGRTTALLDQMSLNIMDARITTCDNNMALNAYHVLDGGGVPIDPVQVEDIRGAIRAELMDVGTDTIRVARRMPRRHRHFPIETAVTFAPDESNHRTMMHLVTLDRPGLLAEVGAVFRDCDIRLTNAKIATVGAEVDDVFFITTEREAPVTCAAALSCLRDEIHKRLEGTSEAG